MTKSRGIGRGGRREGAGRKPDTPEQKAERQARKAAEMSGRSALLSDLVVQKIGLPPRRRLLAGEEVEVRTDGPWLTAFARTFCKQSIGQWAGLPLEFYPEQQAFIDDALSFDDEGRRLYQTACWFVPRKSGKTTTTSALALALASPAEMEGKPIVVMAAGSREQVRPGWDQACEFAWSNPILAQLYIPGRLTIEGTANAALIQRVAGDGKLNHGLNPSCVVADELASWTSPKQIENWGALSTGFGAREDPLKFVITTMGYDSETILGELYRAAWESEHKQLRPEMGGGGFVVKDPQAKLLVHCFAVESGTPFSDIEEWKRANPAPWRTPERIAEDLASKDFGEPEKRRLYGNQWTSARDQWIPSDLWERAADAAVEIPEGATVFVGVDAALTRDLTAVAWAHRLEDGRVVCRARAWSARRDAPAHVVFADGRIDNDEPEAFIRQLAARYRVEQVAYDERFFEEQAKRLSDAGFLVVPMTPSAEPTRKAWDRFHELCVSEQAIVHDGDRVVAAHVAAAAGTMTDRGWKVSKLRQTNPIDALAAIVLAAYFAASDESSVYASRGMILV
jgi:phage terminase large subunit-like protein